MNELYLGDCLEVMKRLPKKSFDLCVTDPPFGILENLMWDNIDVKEFTREWFDLLMPLMKENSSIYMFWSQKYIPLGYQIFEPDRMLVWNRDNLSIPTNNQYLWMYTPLFFKKLGKPYFSSCFTKKENRDVINYTTPQSNFLNNKRYHPTSKPVGLLKILIRNSSQKGDIVFDPFMGCGSTCIAAKQLERCYVGIEKEQGYYDISVKLLSEIDATQQEMW